jgi:hypothetical protein
MSDFIYFYTAEVRVVYPRRHPYFTTFAKIRV